MRCFNQISQSAGYSDDEISVSLTVCGGSYGGGSETLIVYDDHENVGRQPDGSDAFRKECGGGSKNAGQAELQCRDRNREWEQRG